MSNPYRANQYKQTQVGTANRGQVLLMLYEGAIRACRRAAEALDRGDLAEKGMQIGKAHDIINELNNSLDHSVAGAIASDLERLYNFMTEQLIKANMENSKDPLQAVQKLLETLFEGWKGAVEQAGKAK